MAAYGLLERIPEVSRFAGLEDAMVAVRASS
jgi:hypothetical protein